METPAETRPQQLHFNGFKVSANSGEITMDLTLDGKGVAILHAPRSVAETLGQTIEQAVGEQFPPGSLLHLYTPERDAEELLLAKGSSLRIEDE
jgi:hypothetical protein